MQPITRSRGVTHAAAMRAVAVIALATYSLNNLNLKSLALVVSEIFQGM